MQLAQSHSGAMSFAQRLRALVPICQWLPAYKFSWLSSDVIAGTTLAAYAIPVSLAYATLAGLPPEMGLYCYLAGGIGYALFGSSLHLAIGPTSAISLLLGVSLLEIAATDQQRLAALASLTALVMAVVFAIAWLLRLSVLVNFISESILTGFKAGAALVIAATQLPKLFGVQGGGDSFFERMWLLSQQIGSTNLTTLAIGTAGLVLLLLGERFLPGRPVALGVVILALIAVAFGQLERFGVSIVGTIPAGLPALHFPAQQLSSLDLHEARHLVRLAAACFLLSYIESVSAARTFALKHQYDINPRQEMVALGMATLLAGLWQGYPVAGGLSQSAVNERGGARTPLSLLVASAAICIVLLLLTGFFRTLPNAILAAVVLVAVKGLIDVRELRYLWRISRLDFAAAMVALLGVLLMGVLDGVMVAVLASVLMLLWKSARPQVAFLGRIPNTNRFSDMARHPDNEKLAGVVAFRVQSSLLYFNVDHVLDVVRQRIKTEEGLRLVICDLSNVPYVDVAGARMLRRLHQELSTTNVRFVLVEAHGPVRDTLRAAGLDELVGAITRFSSLAEVIEQKLATA